jgi:hypothetical protein
VAPGGAVAGLVALALPLAALPALLLAVRRREAELLQDI